MALKQTLESIKSKLNALVTYSNSITSKSDTTIGDCVRSLAEGYGQGGNTKVDILYEKTFDATTSSSSQVQLDTFSFKDMNYDLYVFVSEALDGPRNGYWLRTYGTWKIPTDSVVGAISIKSNAYAHYNPGIGINKGVHAIYPIFTSATATSCNIVKRYSGSAGSTVSGNALVKIYGIKY